MAAGTLGTCSDGHRGSLCGRGRREGGEEGSKVGTPQPDPASWQAQGKGFCCPHEGQPGRGRHPCDPVAGEGNRRSRGSSQQRVDLGVHGGHGQRVPPLPGKEAAGTCKKGHVGPGHIPSTGVGGFPQPRKGPESEGCRAGHGVIATDGHMWGTEGEK